MTDANNFTTFETICFVCSREWEGLFCFKKNHANKGVKKRYTAEGKATLVESEIERKRKKDGRAR